MDTENRHRTTPTVGYYIYYYLGLWDSLPEIETLHSFTIDQIQSI